MHVLVAGATGAIGIPLVRALAGAGHRVTGMTRSPEKRLLLTSLGAEPVVADALDGAAIRRVLEDTRPTHVIHQLTALPKFGPRGGRDLESTNRLRIEGTRHLIEAAAAAGSTRMIAGSFVFGHAPSAGLSQGMVAAIEAIHSMEAQVLEASRAGRIEGVVLRYGLFYGLELDATRAMMAASRRRFVPAVARDRSLLPGIHIEDAVAATVLALDRGREGRIYDVVDDQAMSLSDMVRTIADAAGAPSPLTVPRWLVRLSPYLSDVVSLRLRVSNAAAKTALGWRPKYASPREGLGLEKRQAA